MINKGKRQEKRHDREQEQQCQDIVGQRRQEAEKRKQDAEKRQHETERRLRELQK